MTEHLKLSLLLAVLVFVCPRPSYSQDSEQLTIAPKAAIETAIGKSHLVTAKQAVVRISFESQREDELRNRCANIRDFIAQNLVDQSNLSSVLAVEPKPTLKIVITSLQPEHEQTWKLALDQYVSNRVDKFNGYTAPYRPSLIELGISLEQPEIEGLEALEFAKTQKLLNESLRENIPKLSKDGFMYFPIESGLFPCTLLDYTVSASTVISLKSFDVVKSTRLLAESDVRKIVRATEKQLAADNHPEGYVNPDNLKQFLFFRSVESIGRTFTWLEKQKVAVWQQFIENWSSRLEGKVRPLTEEELYEAGQILTSTTYDATLLTLRAEKTVIDKAGN